jgi:hypothetical protein
MLREVFGEHSLSERVVFEWHSRFKASQVSTEDDNGSGHPIRELIHNGQIIHELTDAAGISYGVYQEILTENMNMHHVAAKFVPRLLTNDQKQWSINVCLEL